MSERPLSVEASQQASSEQRVESKPNSTVPAELVGLLHELPPDEEKVLKRALGQETIEFVKNHGHDFYIYDWIGSNYSKGEIHFAVPVDDRVLTITTFPQGNNSKQAMDIKVSFSYLDDFASMVKNQEVVEKTFTRAESSLQQGTLKFLRFTRGLISRIPESTQVFIAPSDQQRYRIYQKALSKLRKPNLILLEPV